VNCIFEKNESLIEKQDFLTAFTGDLDENSKADWMFSPEILRDLFIE
jgi:hypothetical protein